VPLACGGPDAVSNMQWQTVADARATDAGERRDAVIRYPATRQRRIHNPSTPCSCGAVGAAVKTFFSTDPSFSSLGALSNSPDVTPLTVLISRCGP
jgi:hypothetical protein